jgi:hypothetical protein
MKALLAATLATAGLAAASAAAAADIDVMTQNQYLGADIAPLVEPGISQDEFLARVAIALQQVAENRPRERIVALAAEIAARQPHLVGLQEVFAFSCVNMSPLADVCGQLPPAFNDHLALLEQSLGDSYRVVATVQNLDVALPFFVVEELGIGAIIGVVDRDVILARRDVEAAPLPPALRDLTCAESLRSADGCRYTVTVPLDALGTRIFRGYVAATASVGGRPYLFVNTHLETREPFAFFQSLQAMELAGTVGFLGGYLGVPVVAVGDFNSSPNDTNPVDVPPIFPGVPAQVPSPYMTMSSMMSDAWLFRPGNVAGLSCCQLADLSNHKSQLSERIDLIWSSVPPLKVKQARVIGDTVNTRTSPPGRGKWPSDHGSVAATLQLP